MSNLTPKNSRFQAVRFAALLPMFLSLSTLVSQPLLAQEVRPSRVLTVTGHGDRPVQTNKAQIQLSVDVEAKTASEAQEGMARKASAVIAKLQELQVEKLQTTSINLNPKYEYLNNRQIQVGFLAQSSVSFRIATERAGQTLDAAVAAGATRIDQISFVAPVDAMQTARNAALQDAVKDAQNQADAILSVLNLKAQAIRTIQVNNFEAVPPIMLNRGGLYAAESKASTPVLGGEQRVQTAVTLEITY